MRRQLLGLFVASFAAPYLVAALMVAFTWLKGESGSFVTPLDAILLIGTASALASSLPTAMIALILALLLWISGLYSCPSIVGVGTALGGCFVGLLFRSTPEVVEASLSGVFSGAICGWIYWRIAVGCPRCEQHVRRRIEASEGSRHC